MPDKLVLISHKLCPYVQRAAIVLHEKNVPFKRRDVDLANKPEWFCKVSPLGKTPVLLVNDEPIFESAVICEFLDETRRPAMHPAAPLERARHRAYMEFGSSILNSIAAFYNARTEEALHKHAADIRHKFEQMDALLGEGPYFVGSRFSLVDAVFGPIFRYFDVFEQLGEFGFFIGQPKVRAWRTQLQNRPSVKQAVSSDYPQLLRAFLADRNSALSQRIAAVASH